MKLKLGVVLIFVLVNFGVQAQRPNKNIIGYSITIPAESPEFLSAKTYTLNIEKNDLALYEVNYLLEKASNSQRAFLLTRSYSETVSKPLLGHYYLGLNAMEKVAENGDLAMSIQFGKFEIESKTTKEKKKPCADNKEVQCSSWYYEVKYRLHCNLIIKNKDGVELYSQEVAGNELYKANFGNNFAGTFATKEKLEKEFQAQNGGLILERGAILERLAAANDHIYEHCTYHQKKLNTNVFSVNSKKVDYSYLDNALAFAKKAYETDDLSLLSESIKIWKEELATADFINKKARINKKIALALMNNIISANYFLNKFDEADAMLINYTAKGGDDYNLKKLLKVFGKGDRKDRMLAHKDIEIPESKLAPKESMSFSVGANKLNDQANKVTKVGVAVPPSDAVVVVEDTPEPKPNEIGSSVDTNTELTDPVDEETAYVYSGPVVQGKWKGTDAEVNDADMGPAEKFTDIFFLNDTKGWAVGKEGELYTTNDVKTWHWEKMETKFIGYDNSEVQPNRMPYTGLQFYDEKRGVLNGHLTVDGGVTWKFKENLLDDVFFLDAKNWISSRGPGISRSTDGGLTWKYEAIEKNKGGKVAMVTKDKFCIAHYEYSTKELTVSITDKGFKTFEQKFYLKDESMRMEPQEFYFTDENTGWLILRENIILHTTDGGDTWSTIDMSPLLKDFRNADEGENIELTAGVNIGDHMWVAVNFGWEPEIYYSPDAGLSWEKIHTSFEDFQGITAMYMNKDFIGWAGGNALHRFEGKLVELEEN